jgi:hypothetical protein
MPCMGPDLTLARKHGRKVGEQLLAQLIKDNHFWDITAPEDKTKCVLRLPGAEKRWDKAKEGFLKAVEELFVEDESNGF